jgi:hypothetical protein
MSRKNPFQMQPQRPPNGGMVFGTTLAKITIEIDNLNNIRLNATGPGRQLSMIEVMDMLATVMKMQTNMVIQQNSMVIDPNRANPQSGIEYVNNDDEGKAQEDNNGSGRDTGGTTPTG